MALLRTVLAFVILVILAHLGLVYSGIDANQNGLTSSIVSLGELLEIPARAVINALPNSSEQQRSIQEQSLYLVGLLAAGGYFILFLLLGVGRR